jgi:DNA-binding CsgD family transcriptional regulator
MEPPSQLVDDIYEAGSVPEFWPRALEKLAATVDGAGAALFAVRADGLRSVASPSMLDLLREFDALGRPELNRRTPRALARRHPGFLTEADVFTEEELETDPFYTDFLRPRGFGWCAGSAIFVPGGDTIVISVEKRFAFGPVPREHLALLDRMRPHLARAAAFSARLALDRVRSATEALGLIGLPAAVLGDRQQLLSANPLFEDLIPDVVRARRERLMLADQAADRLLADAFARSLARAGGGVQSIPIAAQEARPAMVAHLLPVRGVANDVFSAASGLLMLTPVVTGQGPPRQLLEGLFDLSPAEARVAGGLADGATVEQLASRKGISQETVRGHLKAVFAKTGTHRQSELVRLLAGPWHF